MPKSFFEVVNLLEGVSVTIKDMEYPSHVDDIGSLEQALSLAIRKAFPTLNLSHEVVQQDGFSPEQTEGIINFYHVKALTPEQIKKIEQAILYYLKEFNVQLTGKTFTNQSNMYQIPVTRIPVKINNQRGERVPEVDMSQQMAAIIMHDILNYPRAMNFNMATLDARDLLVKLSQVHDYSIDKHVEEPKQDKNFYSGGVTKERIQRHLDNLTRLAQYALEHGYTELVFS